MGKPKKLYKSFLYFYSNKSLGFGHNQFENCFGIFFLFITYLLYVSNLFLSIVYHLKVILFFFQVVVRFIIVAIIIPVKRSPFQNIPVYQV